ncbi:hypothetical protein IC235_02175 [Hymenobacter sp. BT664]|uniref:Uncharacterized protein n=1 Tax=Hymenobacter montanus TaxID=2771359 RepID=A0A927BAF2_9BACT|nr:hypothetical protein [Hymenobacter montanus]MBD2766695.1 hypothetical protein [Hymenobacter montanus]
MSEEDIIGIYTMKGLSNNVDTLRILPGGKYTRVLYSKMGKRLLFHNSNKWKCAADRIILYEYLMDEDEKHMPQEILGVGTVAAFLPIKRRFNKIVIYYRNGGDDSSYYEKE